MMQLQTLHYRAIAGIHPSLEQADSPRWSPEQITFFQRHLAPAGWSLLFQLMPLGIMTDAAGQIWVIHNPLLYRLWKQGGELDFSGPVLHYTPPAAASLESWMTLSRLLHASIGAAHAQKVPDLERWKTAASLPLFQRAPSKRQLLQQLHINKNRYYSPAP